MTLSVQEAAREAPKRVALVHGGGETTWAELAERAAWISDAVRRILARRKHIPPDNELRSFVAPAPVVGIVGDTDVPTVAALLAMLEDRVPIVLLHPRWTPAERDRALAMAGVSLVIDGERVVLPQPCEASIAENPGVADNGGAVVAFTSGSTGRPRGAVLRFAALRASAAAHATVFGWRRDDRWLLSLSTAHVGGLMIVARSLLARSTIVLDERAAGGGFDADGALQTIRRHRATLLSVVPTMLGRLLDGSPAAPPSSLRAVLVGGAPAPAALMARARRRGWPVFATYGLTEACSQVATQRPETPPARENRQPRQAPRSGQTKRGDSPAGVEVGPPVPGIELRTPRGAIQIRGDLLFEGYLGDRPWKPLERPFDADGWFDTGDLGAIDEHGDLHVVGRRSDRILSGGENVDPAEVEAAVLEWPGAAAVCVVGVDDAEWGERVAAVVAGSDQFEAAGGLAGLDDHLRSRLAGFKRPRRWRVVERLPTAPTGKVDRRACRGLFAAYSSPP